MDLQSLIGIGIAITSGVFGGKYIFGGADGKKAIDANTINDLIDRIQGQDKQSPGPQPIPVPVPEDLTPSRLQALTHVEALLRYFESTKSPEGVESLSLVTSAILTTKG